MYVQSNASESGCLVYWICGIKLATAAYIKDNFYQLFIAVYSGAVVGCSTWGEAQVLQVQAPPTSALYELLISVMLIIIFSL